MIEALAPSRPERLEPGSHVCWIVSEMAEYVDAAADLLIQAPASAQKPVVFGPEDSEPLAELAPLADIVMDPWRDVLEGQLAPAKMFTFFREQAEASRAEGHSGLRVIADMDWVAAARPSTDQLVEFELLLGALVKELDASIICAYRKSSFAPEVTTAMLSVHGLEAGGESPPQFKMYAGHEGTWRLSGEIDLAVASMFETAITRAIGAGGSTIDVSDIRFIDVAGMRQIAQAAHASAQPIRLIGAPPMLRRMWDLADFANIYPSVQLIDGHPGGERL